MIELIDDSAGPFPYYFIQGEPKNLSQFRAFGCRAYPYLDGDHHARGKHIPRAVEGVNLEFSQEGSGYRDVISVPSMITTKHVRFDESYFPYRKQSVISEYVNERLENQL